MKKEETVSKEVKVTTWYCDLCEVEGMLQPPISQGQHSVCDHCRKDLCLKHRRHFIKSIEWSRGFQMHIGPSIAITLCDECREISMTYEEFLNLFFSEMKQVHSFLV